MWTTKRLLQVLAGFAVFFSAYLVYSVYLGGIDGLPPLPEECFPGKQATTRVQAPKHRNMAEEKLSLAFGQNQELESCEFKLIVGQKNLVLASKDFVILPDGRVKLFPFYCAVFGKRNVSEEFPEVNTIQSKVAYLTFDRPVSNFTEMGSRKIVAGELVDDVLIRNNRRTASELDDLSLHTPGPLYYREDQNLIWTLASVRMLDTQSKPEPTLITAEGMDLHLTKNDAAAKAVPVKPKGQAISGLESVHLRSTVAMYLRVDSQSGFLAGSKPAAESSQEKPKLVITTQGPFFYEVQSDRARFEVPQRARQAVAAPVGLPEKVLVTRLSGPPGQVKRDLLKCERLDLQFQRKAESPAAGREERSMNLAIANAHAMGREVELESDGEGLHAHGNDFYYDAQKHESLLKGTPEMIALKDGHEIHASSLRMSNVGQKEAQTARARGPGTIAMLDRATGKRTMHARWQDELEFGKEGVFDCLTLTGTAAFEDRENGQLLGADRLKVWLEPPDRGKNGKDEQHRLRPNHIEAQGHVSASSPELIVTEPTEHLLIWFKEGLARSDLPAAASDARGAKQTPLVEVHVASKTPGQAWTPSVEQNVAVVPQPGMPAVPPSATPGSRSPHAQPQRAPKKPIVLSARSVEVFVLRSASNKNELDKLSCNGAVHVQQEPASPQDKGVDIRGDTLQLNHSPEGSLLVVTGNLAQVQLNKITILGPEVNIDQKVNKAWVNGIGSMQLPSQGTLQGEKKDKPSDLTIHWNERMFFNGQYALFHGGVQAVQDSSNLLCQEMQVFLDRPVSFKEGEKGGQSAKVKTLVCDKSVRIEEKVQKPNERLPNVRRLAASVVDLNNDEGKLIATGPGFVQIHQKGPAEETGPGSAPLPSAVLPSTDPDKANAANDEFKLTRVHFLDRMYANNNNRSATFYGNVEVYHLPTDNIDVAIDIDRPPPGCLYLRCEQLKVFNRRLPSGQSSQEMEAHKRVVVQTQEFWGLADEVKFDESKDLVIFEGGEGGMATLYRVKSPGAAPDKLIGKKIFYWRRTNETKIEGGKSGEL